MTAWLRNRRKKRGHLYSLGISEMRRLCTNAIVQMDSTRWVDGNIKNICPKCADIQAARVAYRLQKQKSRL